MIGRRNGTERMLLCFLSVKTSVFVYQSVSLQQETAAVCSWLQLEMDTGVDGSVLQG